MAHAGKETATTIEPHPASGSVASPAVAAGRIRVLLVEPRRIYADMLARTLRAEEFAVDVARSDAEAFTQEHGGRVLAFTDVAGLYK